MSEQCRECDVLIVGASMAGSCLARQLKLRHPEMDIVVVERKSEFSHWVGESTLEVFWDYAVRHLDLGPYLDKNHLFKHGLRFFFDSEQHDLPLEQMSEFGRTWIHGVPAHQLDRKKFDTDLCRMNRESGIDVRLGESVSNITLDAERGHRIRTDKGQYQCRWVVDAAGFAAPLARQLGTLEKRNDTHPVSSYWGRFKYLSDMDLQGDIEWRARVNHTSRVLASNHFIYHGYWIWFIQLDDETTSIGLTVNHAIRPDLQTKNARELFEFIKSHRGLGQLFNQRTSIEDFSALKGLPRHARQAYSADRWFMTGMAAGFIEPLLSPGCAHLADANRMIGDLIATDMAGKQREFEDKALCYSVYSRLWWEAVLMQIQGLYTGSFDVHMMFFQPALMNYFGMILPTSMAERWGYQEGLPEGITFDALLAEAMKRIGPGSVLSLMRERADEFEQYLRERGLAYSNNRGKYFDSEAPQDVLRHTLSAGRTLCPDTIASLFQTMYAFCLEYALRRMAEIEDIQISPARLSKTVAELSRSGGSLHDGLELLRPAPNGHTRREIHPLPTG